MPSKISFLPDMILGENDLPYHFQPQFFKCLERMVLIDFGVYVVFFVVSNVLSEVFSVFNGFHGFSKLDLAVSIVSLSYQYGYLTLLIVLVDFE